VTLDGTGTHELFVKCPVFNYGLERVETGLLCPWGFVLPLARTSVSLLGLLLDVQPASLLGPKTLHEEPVTVDECGTANWVDPYKFVSPSLKPAPPPLCSSPRFTYSTPLKWKRGFEIGDKDETRTEGEWYI
jgi:hypothetical protein